MRRHQKPLEFSWQRRRNVEEITATAFHRTKFFEEFASPPAPDPLALYEAAFGVDYMRDVDRPAEAAWWSTLEWAAVPMLTTATFDYAKKLVMCRRARNMGYLMCLLLREAADHQHEQYAPGGDAFWSGRLDPIIAALAGDGRPVGIFTEDGSRTLYSGAELRQLCKDWSAQSAVIESSYNLLLGRALDLAAPLHDNSFKGTPAVEVLDAALAARRKCLAYLDETRLVTIFTGTFEEFAPSRLPTVLADARAVTLERLKREAQRRIATAYHGEAAHDRSKEWEVRLSGRDLTKENAEHARLHSAYKRQKTAVAAMTLEQLKAYDPADDGNWAADQGN